MSERFRFCSFAAGALYFVEIRRRSMGPERRRAANDLQCRPSALRKRGFRAADALRTGRVFQHDAPTTPDFPSDVAAFADRMPDGRADASARAEHRLACD